MLSCVSKWLSKLKSIHICIKCRPFPSRKPHITLWNSIFLKTITCFPIWFCWEENSCPSSEDQVTDKMKFQTSHTVQLGESYCRFIAKFVDNTMSGNSVLLDQDRISLYQDLHIYNYTQCLTPEGESKILQFQYAKYAKWSVTISNLKFLQQCIQDAMKLNECWILLKEFSVLQRKL